MECSGREVGHEPAEAGHAAPFVGAGRGTSAGHSAPSGQLSENHWKASRRPLEPMSLFFSNIAFRRLPSLNSSSESRDIDMPRFSVNGSTKRRRSSTVSMSD